MSDSVGLGKVEASVGLDLRPLKTGVSEAAKILSGFGKTLDDLKFNPSGVLAGLKSIQVGFEGLKFNPASSLNGFTAVKDELKALTADLGTVRGGLGELRKSLDLGRGHLTGLSEVKSDLLGVGKAATGTRERIENLGKVRVNMGAMVTGADTAISQINSVARAARSARTELNPVIPRRLMSRGGYATGSMLRSIGSGMSMSGQMMTQGYSQPVTQAFGYAVKKGVDYEADFANVAKTVGGSDQELKKLKADLLDLSTKVPESFKTITDIASTVGQLGVARDEVKNVTKDIIQLHVATKLTTESGAMQMVKFANSIGLPARDIGRLGSVISELDKDSKATSNEVLSMALRIGGVGHIAGLSGPQILAFANAFAGVGVRAQQGGSSISQAIIQIDRAANKGGAKLAEFANVAGMSADQFKTAFKTNAAGALAAFIEGLGKLHDRHVDLIPIMDALGLKSKLEVDALTRASGAGNALSAALSRVDKAYQDNTATGERYARATDNTKSKLIELQNGVDKVAAKLGDTLIPVLMKLEPDVEKLLNTVSHLIDEFNNLPEPVKQGALELLAVTVAAGPVVTVVGGIVTVLGALSQGFAAFSALKAGATLAEVATGAEEAGAAQAAFASSGAGLLGKTGLYGLALAGIIYDINQIAQLWGMAKDAQANYAAAKVGDAKVDAGYAALAASPVEKKSLAGNMAQISSTIHNIQDEMAALKSGYGDGDSRTPGILDLQKERRRTAKTFGNDPDPSGQHDTSGALHDMLQRYAALAGDLAKQQASYKKEKVRLDQFSPAGQGSSGSKAGEAVGKQIVSGIALAVKTPEGQASCAYFASEVMRQAGINIPKTGGAKALRDELVKAGAVGKPGSQAQPGDVIVYHGAKYGKNGSGYHVALYEGNDKIVQSSGDGPGHIKQMGFYDKAHATAYSIPDSLIGKVPYSPAAAASGGATFNPALFGDPEAAKLAERNRKLAEKKAEHQAKIAAGINLQDGRLATESPMSKFDKQRMQAVFGYQDKIRKPGVDQGKAFAALSGKLTQIGQAEDAAMEKHKQAIEKHLVSIRQSFDTFVAGMVKMTGKADAKAVKADKAPNALETLRDGKLKTYATDYTHDLNRITKDHGTGALSQEDVVSAVQVAQAKFRAARESAWAEYNAAVQQQSDAAERDVNSLQTQIARATSAANAHVWKNGAAEAQQYFQSLRDAALDSFNQIEDRIAADPKLTDDQKAAAHTGNKGTYDSRLADYDMQEIDAAKKRKINEAATNYSAAQDSYAETGNKQGYANDLAAAKSQIPQDGGLEAQRLRTEIDKQLRKLSQDGKGTVSELGKSVIDSLGSAFDQAMSHAKKAGSVWKEIMESMKLDAKSIFLSFLSKEFKDGLLSLFTHREKGVNPQGQAALTGGGAAAGAASLLGSSLFGGLVPSVKFGSGSQAHGLNGLLGAMPLLSGLSQIHGINGPIGGLGGGKGGGLMDIAGLAASFLPGGSLLGKLFGGGGGLFGSLKKLHLFKNGGIVPGAGFHDTVPALLTPGEVVSNHEQQKAQGGDTHFHFNHYGDVHGVEDMEAMHRQGAFMLAQQLTTATPGN